MGNGEFINVWSDRWLLREVTFKVYISVNEENRYMKVGELIDQEVGEWKKDLVESLFLEGDASSVLDIFFCI